MRKVFFWSTFTGYEPVLWAEVELILRERDQGAYVVGVHCDGVLPRCHAMRSPYKDHITCAGCQIVWRHLIAPLLDEAVHLRGPVERLVGPVPLTQEALRGFTLDGSDLGRAVLSTMKTDAGDDDPVLTSRSQDVALRLSAAKTVHARLGELLDRFSPDMVYMFNGRQFDSRPLLRLCEVRGIHFRTYETAIAPNSFTLRENTTVHNVTVAQAHFSAFLAQWDSRVDPARYVDSIRGGRDIYGHDFRRGQALETLPVGFDPDCRSLLILHSSEDEYADVDHSLRLWVANDFADFIDRLLKRVDGNRDLRVYVRLHPRLARYQANSVRRLLNLTHPQLEVIPPESSVDTFALARAATLAICYGSTAGPEAVLVGARVVCVGECDYSRSGIMPDIFTLDELLDFAYLPEQVKCEPKRALAFLEFLRTSGDRFAFVRVDEFRLEKVRALRWLNAFRNLLLRFRLPIRRLGVDRLVLALYRLSGI